MNEPIINPWWFYLASVCEQLSVFAAVACAASGVAAWWCGIRLVCEPDEIGLSKLNYFFKKALCICAVASTILLVVPNKGTIISMMVASVITKENIKITRDEVISLISDVRKAVTGMERESK